MARARNHDGSPESIVAQASQQDLRDQTFRDLGRGGLLKTSGFLRPPCPTAFTPTTVGEDESSGTLSGGSYGLDVIATLTRMKYLR